MDNWAQEATCDAHDIRSWKDIEEWERSRVGVLLGKESNLVALRYAAEELDTIPHDVYTHRDNFQFADAVDDYNYYLFSYPHDTIPSELELEHGTLLADGHFLVLPMHFEAARDRGCYWLDVSPRSKPRRLPATIEQEIEILTCPSLFESAATLADDPRLTGEVIGDFLVEGEITLVSSARPHDDFYFLISVFQEILEQRPGASVTLLTARSRPVVARTLANALSPNNAHRLRVRTLGSCLGMDGKQICTVIEREAHAFQTAVVMFDGIEAIRELIDWSRFGQTGLVGGLYRLLDIGLAVCLTTSSSKLNPTDIESFEHLIRSAYRVTRQSENSFEILLDGQESTARQQFALERPANPLLERPLSLSGVGEA